VECVDSEHQLKFRQVFKDNMTIAMDPTISKCTASEAKQGDYVKVTFSPDLARFKMDRLDEDTVGLLSRRAYDIAGTMGNRGGKALQVHLNGKKLEVKNFSSYIALYEGIGSPVAFQADERWEVGIGLSSEGTPQQISFVNAIATSKGGRHVKYIEGMIADHLLKVLTKKDKKTTVKKSQIANHLTIVINCLIENPSFDSQTKDSLNTQTKAFGSTFTCSPSFLKKIEKSEIVDHILSFALFKDKQALKRKGGTKKKKLTGITKLDDANNAGSAKSKDCTLIITEGDSAKSLAVAGLSVVGRDYYGVFPLKGKPLNVRDSKIADVIKNEEIKNLVDILGLVYGTEYDESNVKSLRYGHLVIMADQDTDGSHSTWMR
jgi:DNA topoisomerase-2